jgi:hypothetical protein
VDRFTSLFCPAARGALEWLHQLTPRGAVWTFNTCIPAVGGPWTYHLPRVTYGDNGPRFSDASIPEPKAPGPGRKPRDPWISLEAAVLVGAPVELWVKPRGRVGPSTERGGGRATPPQF